MSAADADATAQAYSRVGSSVSAVFTRPLAGGVVPPEAVSAPGALPPSVSAKPVERVAASMQPAPPRSVSIDPVTHTAPQAVPLEQHQLGWNSPDNKVALSNKKIERADVSSQAESAVIAAPADFTQAAPAGSIPKPLAAGGHKLFVQTTADAWVEIRKVDGTILINHLMKPGETIPVLTSGSLLLSTGNAGATQIIVDSDTSGPLGANGVPLRDVPLGQDWIKRITTIKAPLSKASAPASADRQAAPSAS
jgi:cytoskeleton protein RodZ